MFLANSVRRINKISIEKCLSNCLITPKCSYMGLAHNSRELPGHSQQIYLNRITSTILFTKSNKQQRNQTRYYTTDRNDKYDDDDDDLDSWHRKLPSFGECYISTPSTYLMLKNKLSTLLIRSYFDSQFNKDEFLNGAKRAIEVTKHLTIVCDFIEFELFYFGFVGCFQFIGSW